MVDPQAGNNSGNSIDTGAAAGPPPKPTVAATVATRLDRYMIAPRSLPGVQPMAADVLVNSINSLADIKIVRRLQPRGLGAFSTGSGGASPEIIVAEMEPARGQTLRNSAPPNIIVERDVLLRHADSFMLPDPGYGAQDVGIDIMLRIVGADGRPLPKAVIYVYGLGFPAQGVTNDRGEATITFFGGPIETVQGIYVKPVANHWDRLIRKPILQPNGMNTLQLHPLSETFQGFPDTGIFGWGQLLMKLDQIDPSYTGAGVKIGIIDSGCDNTHPQLGHITHGADMTNGGDASSWTTDTMGHGTHCAGVIAGGGDKRRGIRGFAPGAEVHSLKVFPGGRFSDLIDALDQCINRQIDVINMSLGSAEASELVVNKLNELRINGVACVVAAGNSGGAVQFPGTVPGMLTVSAIGMAGQFPPDSNHAQTMKPELTVGPMFSPTFTCFGPQIAVAGPGVAIISTVPGGGYAAWDGTSMAAPHITGMAALLLAHHPMFQQGQRKRDASRVNALFSLIASGGVIMLGSPQREGAGVIRLDRLLKPAIVAGNQFATAAALPPGEASQEFTGSVSQEFGAGPQSNVAPWLYGMDPAIMQRLYQLRLAGVI